MQVPKNPCATVLMIPDLLTCADVLLIGDVHIAGVIHGDVGNAGQFGVVGRILRLLSRSR